MNTVIMILKKKIISRPRKEQVSSDLLTFVFWTLFLFKESGSKIKISWGLFLLLADEKSLTITRPTMLMLGKGSASKKTEEAVINVNTGRPYPAVNSLRMATALVCPPALSLRLLFKHCPTHTHTHTHRLGPVIIKTQVQTI